MTSMIGIDINKQIQEYNEKIEAEIAQKYPNAFTISFQSLITITPFFELLYKASAIGVDLVVDKNGEIVIDGTIKFKVPESSCFETLDDEYLQPLAGEYIAKIVKNELVHILTKFCIRFTSSDDIPVDKYVKFKFIEKGSVTEESYEGKMNEFRTVQINKAGIDIYSNASGMKKDIMTRGLKTLGELLTYGIFVHICGYDDIIPFPEMLKSLDKSSGIVVSVPERSEFSINGTSGGEISGINAQHYTNASLKFLADVGLINISDITYEIRPGKWTKKDYANAESKVSSLLNLYMGE